MRVGLISDTHGLLRPQACAVLRGADRIIHAGDIGERAILDELESIAPVVAVRGNVDRDAWTRELPTTAVLECGEQVIYVVHDIADLDLDPAAGGFAAVVYGHSHRPGIAERAGVLFVNPGSAGPRRFRLPVSVGWIEAGDAGVRAEIQELDLG